MLIVVMEISSKWLPTLLPQCPATDTVYVQYHVLRELVRVNL